MYNWVVIVVWIYVSCLVKYFVLCIIVWPIRNQIPIEKCLGDSQNLVSLSNVESSRAFNQQTLPCENKNGLVMKDNERKWTKNLRKNNTAEPLVPGKI